MNFRDQKVCPVDCCTVRYASCVFCRFVHSGCWEMAEVVCVCASVCLSVSISGFAACGIRHAARVHSTGCTSVNK
jgi:hypothetical protein